MQGGAPTWRPGTDMRQKGVLLTMLLLPCSGKCVNHKTVTRPVHNYYVGFDKSLSLSLSLSLVNYSVCYHNAQMNTPSLYTIHYTEILVHKYTYLMKLN